VTLTDRVFAFDVRTPLLDSDDIGHNRWHPDIPPLARVTPGETIIFDVRDGLDGQVTAQTTLASLAELDLARAHPLTGPFYIEGAEPGDLLQIEVLEIEPDQFGWTTVSPGFGLLSDRFDERFVVRWNIENGIARSDDLPGVAIPGEPFLGVMGVAPSRDRLVHFSRREAELSRRRGWSFWQPDAAGAVPGSGPMAAEGLRTIPPRETGGNMDIKQLTAGSRLALPVEVPGALFSAGDAHFAQGDGETCGTAIEIHARTRLRFGLRKAAEISWKPRYPFFEYTAQPTPERRYYVTTGLPIDSDGRNEYLDLTLAAKAAVEEMIAYLTDERGYTPQQAYVLVSVAADLRVSEVVDVPNGIVSVMLPKDIFE
jgi:formamidase